MRKLFFLSLATILSANVAISQTDEFVMTWSIVEGEANKSNTEILNPKKAANVKTWTERGRKYIQVYTFDNIENVYYGTAKNDLAIIMKASPKNTKQVGDTTVLSFDRMDFYCVGDKVVKYARTERAKELFFPENYTALDIATEAYLKAKELDVEGKRSEIIGEQLKKLSDLYQKDALFYYYSKDYKGASVYFTKAGNIERTGFTAEKDSSRIANLKNCGEINKAAKNYDQAIVFYNDILAIEKSQTPEMYADIYYCQLMKGDTTSAINTLKTVLEKFPKAASINEYINQLIDLYITSNQTENAMVYLQKALENDPSNTAYLFNMAYLNEKMGNEEAAIENYKKAIEIDSKDENANLNLGVLYENKGNAALEEADKLYGKKGYQAKVDAGKSYLKMALPYIETYANVTKDDARKRNAYRDLMSIYMRLSMTTEYKMTKALYDAL